MANPAQELIQTILDAMQTIASTETIMGKPVTLGDKTVVPISKFSLGFGAGGGSGEDKADSSSGVGAGGGGGIKVEPVAFIVIQGEKVSLLTTKESRRIEAIFDSIPVLIEKVQKLRDKKPKGEEDLPGPEVAEP